MANQRTEQEALRIRAYIAEQTAFSETAISLAHKLGVGRKTADRVLNELVEAGELSRRTFATKIAPVYSRFRSRTSG